MKTRKVTDLVPAVVERRLRDKYGPPVRSALT